MAYAIFARTKYKTDLKTLTVTLPKKIKCDTLPLCFNLHPQIYKVLTSDWQVQAEM